MRLALWAVLLLAQVSYSNHSSTRLSDGEEHPETAHWAFKRFTTNQRRHLLSPETLITTGLQWQPATNTYRTTKRPRKFILKSKLQMKPSVENANGTIATIDFIRADKIRHLLAELLETDVKHVSCFFTAEDFALDDDVRQTVEDTTCRAARWANTPLVHMQVNITVPTDELEKTHSILENGTAFDDRLKAHTSKADVFNLCLSVCRLPLLPSLYRTVTGIQTYNGDAICDTQSQPLWLSHINETNTCKYAASALELWWSQESEGESTMKLCFKTNETHVVWSAYRPGADRICVRTVYDDFNSTFCSQMADIFRCHAAGCVWKSSNCGQRRLDDTSETPRYSVHVASEPDISSSHDDYNVQDYDYYYDSVDVSKTSNEWFVGREHVGEHMKELAPLSDSLLGSQGACAEGFYMMVKDVHETVGNATWYSTMSWRVAFLPECLECARTCRGQDDCYTYSCARDAEDTCNHHVYGFRDFETTLRDWRVFNATPKIFCMKKIPIFVETGHSECEERVILSNATTVLQCAVEAKKNARCNGPVFSVAGDSSTNWNIDNERISRVDDASPSVKWATCMRTNIHHNDTCGDGKVAVNCTCAPNGCYYDEEKAFFTAESQLCLVDCKSKKNKSIEKILCVQDESRSMNQRCLFPFFRDATDTWHHSCVQGVGLEKSWCMTGVGKLNYAPRRFTADAKWEFCSESVECKDERNCSACIGGMPCRIAGSTGVCVLSSDLWNCKRVGTWEGAKCGDDQVCVLPHGLDVAPELRGARQTFATKFPKYATSPWIVPDTYDDSLDSSYDIAFCHCCTTKQSPHSQSLAENNFIVHEFPWVETHHLLESLFNPALKLHPLAMKRISIGSMESVEDCRHACEAVLDEGCNAVMWYDVLGCQLLRNFTCLTPPDVGLGYGPRDTTLLCPLGRCNASRPDGFTLATITTLSNCKEATVDCNVRFTSGAPTVWYGGQEIAVEVDNETPQSYTIKFGYIPSATLTVSGASGGFSIVCSSNKMGPFYQVLGNNYTIMATGSDTPFLHQPLPSETVRYAVVEDVTPKPVRPDVFTDSNEVHHVSNYKYVAFYVGEESLLNGRCGKNDNFLKAYRTCQADLYCVAINPGDIVNKVGGICLLKDQFCPWLHENVTRRTTSIPSKHTKTCWNLENTGNTDTCDATRNFKFCAYQSSFIIRDNDQLSCTYEMNHQHRYFGCDRCWHCKKNVDRVCNLNQKRTYMNKCIAYCEGWREKDEDRGFDSLQTGDCNLGEWEEWTEWQTDTRYVIEYDSDTDITPSLRHRRRLLPFVADYGNLKYNIRVQLEDEDNGGYKLPDIKKCICSAGNESTAGCAAPNLERCAVCPIGFFLSSSQDPIGEEPEGRGCELITSTATSKDKIDMRVEQVVSAVRTFGFATSCHCVERVCNCRTGRPVKNELCPKHGQEMCDTFRIVNGTCVCESASGNHQTCNNGTCGCTTGYHLDTLDCNLNMCRCDLLHASPTNGTECPTDGAEECVCNVDFVFNGTSCEPDGFRCACENGTVANLTCNPLAYTVHHVCVACDPGYSLHNRTNGSFCEPSHTTTTTTPPVPPKCKKPSVLSNGSCLLHFLVSFPTCHSDPARLREEEATQETCVQVGATCVLQFGALGANVTLRFPLGTDPPNRRTFVPMFASNLNRLVCEPVDNDRMRIFAITLVASILTAIVIIGTFMIRRYHKSTVYNEFEDAPGKEAPKFGSSHSDPTSLTRRMKDRVSASLVNIDCASTSPTRSSVHGESEATASTATGHHFLSRRVQRANSDPMQDSDIHSISPARDCKSASESREQRCIDFARALCSEPRDKIRHEGIPRSAEGAPHAVAFQPRADTAKKQRVLLLHLMRYAEAIHSDNTALQTQLSYKVEYRQKLRDRLKQLNVRAEKVVSKIGHTRKSIDKQLLLRLRLFKTQLAAQRASPTRQDTAQTARQETARRSARRASPRIFRYCTPRASRAQMAQAAPGRWAWQQPKDLPLFDNVLLRCDHVSLFMLVARQHVLLRRCALRILYMNDYHSRLVDSVRHLSVSIHRYSEKCDDVMMEIDAMLAFPGSKPNDALRFKVAELKSLWEARGALSQHQTYPVKYKEPVHKQKPHLRSSPSTRTVAGAWGSEVPEAKRRPEPSWLGLGWR